MLRKVTRLLVVCAVAHCAYGYRDIIDIEPPRTEIASASVLIPPPQILPPPPPPYRSSALAMVDAINLLKQKTNFPLTPVKQNLVTIIFAVRVLAEGLSSGLSYSAAYNTINTIVLIGNLMPECARELIITRYDNVLKAVQPVLELILDSCPNGSSEYYCDRKVDGIIKGNPIFKVPAILLLESGKLAARFNQNKIQIFKAAAKGPVEEYLSKNKYVLKPFIDQDAIVLNVERRCQLY